MNIKYEQEHREGARWSEVLGGFLEYLSKLYGYQIDEYSLYPIIWDRRIDRLGPLLNKGNTIADRLVKEAVTYQMEQQGMGERLRREAIEAYTQMLPLSTTINTIKGKANE